MKFKKIIVLFCISTLLVSCSSDESNNDDNQDNSSKMSKVNNDEVIDENQGGEVNIVDCIQIAQKITSAAPRVNELTKSECEVVRKAIEDLRSNDCPASSNSEITKLMNLLGDCSSF